MKSSTYLLVLALSATSLWSQTNATPSTPTAAPPPPSSSSPGNLVPGQPASPTAQLKPRGREAIAQQDPSRVIATIGGKPVTAGEAIKMLKIVRPEDMKKFEGANQIPKLLQEVYMQGEFAKLAEQMHLEDQSPYKEQLRVARENILAQAYVGKITNVGGPAPDLKAYYDAHTAEFEQIKVSGIFVSFNPPGTPAAKDDKSARTEDQARAKAEDLEGKIKGGADFAALARAESDNKASAARGGEIGTFSGSDTALPPEIKTAIFGLDAGQISKPIREQNGFYILRADTRTKKAYNDVQGDILDKIQREKGQAALKAELDKYQIEVKDSDFFASSAPPKPPTPSLANPSGQPGNAGSAAVKPPGKP